MKKRSPGFRIAMRYIPHAPTHIIHSLSDDIDKAAGTAMRLGYAKAVRIAFQWAAKYRASEFDVRYMELEAIMGREMPEDTDLHEPPAGQEESDGE